MSVDRGLPEVLIVEDSDEDHDTVLEALGGIDLPVRTRRAESGDECLAMLAGSGDRQPVRPALLLLDLNTPGRDGRATLRAIRDDGGLGPLPTIVMTTSSNPRDVELCYALGANAYHVKPFDYVEHLAALRGLFDYWLRRVTLPGREGPRRP